jgi:alpha-tubulin suppressor-like RCC1 family protein
LSYRYDAAFIDPGLNTLVAPTPIYTYGLWTWGKNNRGQLGLGDTTVRSSPNQVGALTDWLNISAGGYEGFSLAVKTDGTLWSWGYGTQGALGLGNNTNYSSPKQVGALTGWIFVAAGGYHSVAIKNDGTLWAWGRNTEGQLGLSDTTVRSSPVQVGSLTNWAQISAGYDFNAAIKTDGTLWTWGAGSSGQLGNTNISRSSPVQVGALTNWLRVSTGQLFCLAVKTDGTLWAWGSNNNGQLGDGSTTVRSSPIQVGALTNWSLTTCGTSHSLAITSVGTLLSWGNNYSGQLGLGNRGAYTNRSSPTQVGAVSTWLAVSAGRYFSTALQTNNTLWSWGFNNDGQLGQVGTYITLPSQVGSLTTWGKIATLKGQHTMALQF